MAQVIGPWTRALNSALVLIPSAKLRLYQEGTTTLATVYSDDALTTPHTNPITADGAGYFPQVFATAGLRFDCATLAADGTTLVKNWGAWEALGSQSGTVEYDFGASGRLAIRAASSRPNIEFGDPSPDNVGGTGRIGGQAGTQADAIEIDAATTTMTGAVTVAGALTVTGAGPFEKKLSSATVAAAAEIILDLPTGYTAYRIELAYIALSASASINGYFSFDGSTYMTAAGDYYFRLEYNNSQGSIGTQGGNATLTSTSLRLADATTALAAGTPNRMSLIVLSGAGVESSITGDFYSANSDALFGGQFSRILGGTRNRNFGRASKFKIAPTSGTIALRYAVYGIPGL